MKALYTSAKFLLSVILISGCAYYNTQWKKSLIWDDFTFDQIPGVEEYPGAVALFLLDEGEMVVFSGKLAFSTLTQHTVIKILNERGRKYANVVIPYSSHTEIENIRARAISPEGKIVLLEKDEIYDITLYPDYVFYSDVRAKIFTLKGLENGGLVEYQYTKNIRNPIYGAGWNFQHDDPTLISRYTLVIPPEWKIHWATYDIDLEPKEISWGVGSKRTLTWEARDLPGIDPEYGMPPRGEIRARVAFSPAGVESWEDVGKWFYGLAEERLKPDRGISELAQRLTADCQDNLEKLSVIYQFVQQNIRYVAVEVGIGGFQPHFAGEVWEARYGDCKDMGALIIALCRSVGLQTYPALVSTRFKAGVDRKLPSQQPFDHLIVYASLDPSGVWLDPTELYCPFGQLPWYDQGIDVLVIKEEGKTTFLGTPLNRPEDNRKVQELFVVLDEEGNIQCTGKTHFYGVSGMKIRKTMGKLSPVQRKDWLTRYLSFWCSSAEIDSFTVPDPFPPQDPLTIFYRFWAPHFASREGDFLIFEGGVLNRFESDYAYPEKERNYPLVFDYQQKNIDRVEILIPTGYQIYHLPQSDRVGSDIGNMTISYDQHGDTLLYKRSFEMGRIKVEPEEYPQFKEMLGWMARHDGEKIILKKMTQ
ncbi:DUF3857 domain-containing protein [candidate division KSB1 bacterium]|nr:DUF3857 domain-containing protein [candidate division KSB1 bacterium]